MHVCVCLCVCTAYVYIYIYTYLHFPMYIHCLFILWPKNDSDVLFNQHLNNNNNNKTKYVVHFKIAKILSEAKSI